MRGQRKKLIGADMTDMKTDSARFVLGLGANSRATPKELIALALEALDRNALTPGCVSSVASINRRAYDPSIHAVAHHLGVPVQFMASEQVEAQAARVGSASSFVFKSCGTHSVAEGAALAAAGCGATLVQRKLKSAHGTVAIARLI